MVCNPCSRLALDTHSQGRLPTNISLGVKPEWKKLCRCGVAKDSALMAMQHLQTPAASQARRRAGGGQDCRQVHARCCPHGGGECSMAGGHGYKEGRQRGSEHAAPFARVSRGYVVPDLVVTCNRRTPARVMQGTCPSDKACNSCSGVPRGAVRSPAHWLRPCTCVTRSHTL